MSELHRTDPPGEHGPALIERLRRMGEGLRGNYDEDSEAARHAARLLAELVGHGRLEDVEIHPNAHKVFVFERAGWPFIEMVTDEQPLVRMTLQLLPDEARGIARALNDAADATEGSVDTFLPNGGSIARP